jgi:hypothetical protein
MRSTSVRALLVAVVALVLSGCSVEHHVTGPLPWQPQPRAPDSPTNAIRLFEWGWNHRDLDTFESLLTDDFRFVFALGDSAGNPFGDVPFGREPMIGCLGRLFVGGGLASPAASISLILDPALRTAPDSRPGKNGTWHKEILTSVDLGMRTEDGAEYRILGNARFFVVRGDSALIPAELAVGPDSTRWYIEQWNDETLRDATAAAPGPAAQRELLAPLPSQGVTWGQILALYYWGPRAVRQ